MHGEKHHTREVILIKHRQWVSLGSIMTINLNENKSRPESIVNTEIYLLTMQSTDMVLTVQSIDMVLTVQSKDTEFTVHG